MAAFKVVVVSSVCMAHTSKLIRDPFFFFLFIEQSFVTAGPSFSCLNKCARTQTTSITAWIGKATSRLASPHGAHSRRQVRNHRAEPQSPGSDWTTHVYVGFFKEVTGKQSCSVSTAVRADKPNSGSKTKTNYAGRRSQANRTQRRRIITARWSNSWSPSLHGTAAAPVTNCRHSPPARA